MLRQLVKVANRLDSIGLTKEADIVDAEIMRLAHDIGFGSGIADDAEEIDGYEELDEEELSEDDHYESMETTRPKHDVSPEERLMKMLFTRQDVMKDSRFVDPSGQLKPLEDIGAALGFTGDEVMMNTLEDFLDENGLYAMMLNAR